MSDDDLKRIHQRIADLEAMLRAPAPPKSRPPWAIYGILAVFSLSTSCVLGITGVVEPKPLERVIEVVAPEIVAPGSLVLANDDAPSLATTDDGKAYAFVVGFRSGPDDAVVVAFDRKNWEVAWRSPPFTPNGPVRGHVASTRGLVVYAGATELAVFDGESGHRQFGTWGSKYSASIHVDPEDPDWVITTQTRFPRPHEEALALNVRTAESRARPGAKWSDCPPDFARACITSLDMSPPADVKRAVPNASSTFVVHDGDKRFELVKARVGEGPGQLEYALKRDASKKIAWAKPLAPNRHWKPWPNTVPEGKVAFAGDRILYVYMMPDGQQRITARSFVDGQSLWDVAIEGVGYGAHLAEFTAQGEDAMLVVNQSLVVFDAVTGNVKKRITTF